jgi:hypothetical protein
MRAGLVQAEAREERQAFALVNLPGLAITA